MDNWSNVQRTAERNRTLIETARLRQASRRERREWFAPFVVIALAVVTFIGWSIIT